MIAHCAGPERHAAVRRGVLRPAGKLGRRPTTRWRRSSSWRSSAAWARRQIDACLADKELEDAILQARLDGQQQYDIQSTPSFIIDGKLYAGNQTVDEFAADHRPAARLTPMHVAPAAAGAGAAGPTCC